MVRLSGMSHPGSSPPYLGTVAELEEALLQRIPLQYQADFLQPPHPSALTSADHGILPAQLEAAARLLRQAQESKQRVLIYGDYDCDGVTATALLWETLYHDWQLNVTPFLPHREKHGYGLRVEVLEEIFADQRYDVVITVDNGVVAHEAIAWLKEQGVRTLLTDHHEANGDLPSADVVIHSTQLCGASVAWILAAYLAPDKANERLDFAVLGTLADQVPLYGANRSFAWHGLQALAQSSRLSLQQMANQAGKSLAMADEWLVQYVLAPRINAMGRLGSPMPALRALVTRQPARIQRLLQELEETNKQRQALTEQAMQRVVTQVQSQLTEPCLVIAADIHEGIIGLVAGKLTEQYQRPCIVISTAHAIAKGSCRSVPGKHITEFLRAQNTIPWLSLGGHAQAAGFSIAADNVVSTREQLQQAAHDHWTLPTAQRQYEVVGELSPTLINTAALHVLQRFAPFGAGNDSPRFLLRGSVIGVRWVGKQREHAQFTLQMSGNDAHVQGICFRAHQYFTDPTGQLGTFIVELRPSTFPGKDLELIISDCELASPLP